jgi:fumarate reductase subunit D
MSDVQLDLNEIKQGAPFAALSYIFCLWILTFILKKDNQFAYFHAKQGIIIFVGNVACFVFGFVPLLGVLFGLAQIVLMCFSLYGVYLALTGRMTPIPFVGDLAKKLIV